VTWLGPTPGPISIALGRTSLSPKLTEEIRTGEVSSLLQAEREVYRKFSDNAASGKHLDLNLTINENGLLAQERKLAEAANWRRADGRTWWPPYDGAIPGTQRVVDLKPSVKNADPNLISRYGNEQGYYASPIDVPFEARALPGAYQHAPSPNIYSLEGTIEGVVQSNATGWFGKNGTGRQYMFHEKIQDLVETDLKLGRR
jgi:hypothetical protein